MNDIITLIVNNGIGVVCVAYMIYFQLTTMKEMAKNQEAVIRTLQGINDRLEVIEDKIEKKGE